ncbi:tRNA-binding protein [bacterium]|nr:tRNA-binding protein [bacterium]NCQ55476.1 tRNA-binding protein [Candidatus Parcubacteria bacterium]NCS67838.1 tRNA-binding protein [Candidatus Peregrinibacteria bacterium]NCS96348.1 tRNA-binding protein [bacterium]
MANISWNDFKKVELRAGTITKAEFFEEAKIPAFKLWIDFGPELGEKKSSAQITNYTLENLVGKQVIAVTNFEPKQVANFMSEVLVTGFVLADKTILGVSDEGVPNGSRLL